MDADGEVIGRPRDRSLASFDETLAALSRYDDLTKRIVEGATGLDAEMLLVEHTLGKVGGAAFETRAKALERATPDQRKRIDQILVDAKISALVMRGMRGGPERLEEAATTMLKMLEEGKRPSRAVSSNFWGTLGRAGRETGDAALCRTAAAGMRQDLPENASMISFAKSLEEMAGRLERHAALAARVEGGESGLDVELLLSEYAVSTLR